MMLDDNLELSTLDELFSLDDDEKSFFLELRAEFTESMKEGIEQLKAYQQNSELVLFKEKAHSMKSIAGNLGAKKVFDICKILEKNTTDENIMDSLSVIDGLNQAYLSTEKSFDQLLK